MKYYVTLTGLNYRFGTQPFTVGQKVKLVKEPENDFDREAIRAELPGLGKVGYVANSTHTVLGDCYSAGRIYDKIGAAATAKVKYVLANAVVCSVKAADMGQTGLPRSIRLRVCPLATKIKIFRSERRKSRMGKLTIEGRASKKYDYDQMSVSVTFHSRMSTTSQALKNVMRQSELFLEKLDAAGIAPENVQIGKDSTEEESYHEPYTVRANRELKISTAFSMDFANYIRYLIEENELDAEIETNYAFSNQEAIRAELIRLALEDSKAKAGDIAQTMGQKLVGIESVVVGNDPVRPLVYSASQGENECGDGYYEQLMSVLSRRVKAPTTDRSESVKVVWLTE